MLERDRLFLLVYRAHLEIDSFLRLVSIVFALHAMPPGTKIAISILCTFLYKLLYLSRWLTYPVSLQAMDV